MVIPENTRDRKWGHILTQSRGAVAAGPERGILLHRARLRRLPAPEFLMPFRLRLAACCLGLSPLAAQGSVPAMLAWPQLEVTIHRDSLDLVRIGARMTTGNRATEDVEPRWIQIRTTDLRTWTEAVRRTADSVEKLPRVRESAPQGHVVPGLMGREGLALAFDLARKPDERFFLQLHDDTGVPYWTRYAGPKQVRALLTTLDSMSRLPARPARPATPPCGTAIVLPARKDLFFLNMRETGMISISFVIDTAGVPVDSTFAVDFVTGMKNLEPAVKVVKAMTGLRYSPALCGTRPIPYLMVSRQVRGQSQTTVERRIIRGALPGRGGGPP